MSTIALIGGTGLTRLKEFNLDRQQIMDTPWGEPSAPLFYGKLAGNPVIFMPRHGAEHTLVPHKINYRANIWALHQAEVKTIIAVAAVGGIHPDAKPASIVIPDQIIDYTWGRASTFFEDPDTPVTHIDFSWPYSENLRKKLISTANHHSIPVLKHGVYGCTQGPRLETAAEITRMARDGCTLVGMTGMPEAALARELEIEYACCAVVANAAAGITNQQISMTDIEKNLGKGMRHAVKLLQAFLTLHTDTKLSAD